MPKRTTNFRQDLLADLADPEEASHYLNAALSDSEQMALVALRDVAEARQMSRVAKDAGVAREALYRMLSESGNPTFSNLAAILRSLGLKLIVAPISNETMNSSNANTPSTGSSGGLSYAAMGKAKGAERGTHRAVGRLVVHQGGAAQVYQVPEHDTGMSTDSKPADSEHRAMMERVG
jgi:probable addiction module antidote protein